VDLNRNFPAGNWDAAPLKTRAYLENEPDMELSPGSAPGSEPETRALLGLMGLLTGVGTLQSGVVEPTRIGTTPAVREVLSIHAPLGCVDDPAATALGAWLAEQTGLPRVQEIGYPTPGSLGSWCAGNGWNCITWELPRRSVEECSREYAELLACVLAGEV